ncbi:MAG: class I SAM-dependent methyltransferase [Pseudomonadota bacterium]
MNKPYRINLSAALMTFLIAWSIAPAQAQAADKQGLSETYTQAIASPLRTDADRAADAARKPVQFLQLANAQPGMRVLDVAAGGGYTAQLLALVVGKDGMVWGQATKPGSALEKRLATHPQPNVIAVVLPFDNPVPKDATKLDLITIVMNYHDIAYMPVDRAKMNKSLFDALKAGGHLVVIDHSAKPGTGVADAQTLHRIDEKTVMDEFQQAGFKLEQQSDYLRNPADPREQPFYEMKIPSDKFALRFVKP